MPIAPKAICQRCGRVGCKCRQEARAERQEQYDKQRGTAAERGYNGDWVAFRKAFVSDTTTINGEEVSNALCHDCYEFDGRVIPMQELHHIEKVRDNPERRLDATNCRPLCKTCHSRRTARGE